MLFRSPTREESRKARKEPPRRHLANLRRDLPALMLYGTADPDAPAARKYFGGYAREHDLPVTIVDIEGANHNFSAAAWTRDIAERTIAFCTRLDASGGSA